MWQQTSSLGLALPVECRGDEWNETSRRERSEKMVREKSKQRVRWVTPKTFTVADHRRDLWMWGEGPAQSQLNANLKVFPRRAKTHCEISCSVRRKNGRWAAELDGASALGPDSCKIFFHLLTRYAAMKLVSWGGRRVDFPRPGWTIIRQPRGIR